VILCSGCFGMSSSLLGKIGKLHVHDLEAVGVGIFTLVAFEHHRNYGSPVDAGMLAYKPTSSELAGLQWDCSVMLRWEKLQRFRQLIIRACARVRIFTLMTGYVTILTGHLRY
jgi:hypothetical protein